MTASRPFLGYGHQSIDEADIQAVVNVLKGDFLTQGPVLERFEQALAEKVGAKHVIAVSSGTAALHLACLAADLGPGDVAATSTMTFVATANAPRYCGAETHLVDMDAGHGGMSGEGLAEHLKMFPATKAVLPVHYAGLACGMAQIRDLSGDRIVIEDACHALGGTYENGLTVGCCCHSDMTVFSFHPVKPITTGEGGAITTNDDDLAVRLRRLRNHGIERDPLRFVATDEGSIGPWSYEQQELGFNYRLTDMQAALGMSQLGRLDQFRARRQQIAEAYDRHFASMEHVSLFQDGADQRARSGHHLYVLQVDFQALGVSRVEVMARLRERGIGTQVHYIPVHRQPFHDQYGKVADFPAAEAYFSQAMSIPFYPGLADEDIAYVADAIMDILL